MAVVYLARDLRHERQVAVKVLRPDLAASVVGDRFLREIKLVARLTHQHILALHDSGEADDLLYYVMPYIEGESLRQKLGRERQLAIPEALRLAAEIAEGLEYAHEQGVIHRDIKPENVLLSRGHALIADFGVAKAAASSGLAHLTSSGTSVGTPLYMSPEQAGGDPRVDHRADIYSLGCMVYEMLGGEPPFTGPTVQAVIAKHAMDPRPTVRTLRDTVPIAIDDAIRRAMAKSPADRFQSVRQFGEALAAAPPAVAPPPDTGAGGRWKRAMQVVALLATLGLVTALLPKARGILGLRSTSGYGSTPAWSAWGGWRGEGLTVIAGLDSLLVVSVAGADAAFAFDGEQWRNLALPDSLQLRAFIGAVPGARVLAARSRGTHEPAAAWWLEPADGSIVLESLPATGDWWANWWTDGNDLVIWGRFVERLTAGGWVREPTGTASGISRMWGSAVNRRFAITTSPNDSLLVYDGVSWDLADPFPTRSRETPQYTAGETLADGSSVLVGESCDGEDRCRPFILEQETWGGAWEQLSIPSRIGVPSTQQRNPNAVCQPNRFSFTSVFGHARDDYYVAGDWLWCDPNAPMRMSGGCPPGQPCLWHVTSGGLEPVESLLARVVVGMVSLRGDDYAVTDDATLWRRVGSEWRVVSQVPGLPARFVAASPLVTGRLRGDRFTFEPGPADTASPVFISPEAGIPPGVGPSEPPRRLTIRDTTMVLLTAAGIPYVSRCRMKPDLLDRVRAPRLECLPWEALSAAKDPLLSVDIIEDGTVIGIGGDGLVVAWRDGQVVRETIPPAASDDRLWAVVAAGGGRAVVAGVRTILERDSAGVWTVVRRLPARLGGGRYFAVTNAGEFVVATVVLRLWDRSTDTLAVRLLDPATTALLEPAALRVLPDGRLVVGYATPSEPTLGGRLVVWRPPFRDNRWQDVRMPLRIDITDLGDDGEFLYVVGRGGSLTIPLDSLPFAADR